MNNVVVHLQEPTAEWLSRRHRGRSCDRETNVVTSGRRLQYRKDLDTLHLSV